jgi:hypothetical protein
MKRPSGFTLAFIAVMIGFSVLYFVGVTLFPKYPFEADLPTYSAALLQGEHPELYSRDPIYQDGALTARFWASSSLYMRIFQGLLNLTQRNISTTLALLQFIPSFLICLTFYWFLKVFRLDRWLTLMLSVGLSVWLILRFHEGIASVFYFALIPIFLRLIWQGLSEPSLNGQPVVLWRVALIGAVIGISPLINSVTGLAFNLLILCLLTTQFLALRMRWQSYVAYIIGLIPFLGLAVLSGAGGANMLRDAASGQYLIDRLITASLMGFVELAFVKQAFLKIFSPGESWLFYLPLSAFLAGLSVWLRFAPRPSTQLKMFFVVCSGIFWLWMLGNVGVIVCLYLFSRFAMKRETQFDYVLITALNIAVFNGTALIWFMLGLWYTTHWTTIALILTEMFRFHFQAFFLISVGLLFMIHHLTQRVRDLTIRRIIQFMLILMIVAQPREHILIGTNFIVLMITTLLLIRLARFSRDYFIRPIKRPQSWQKLLGMLSLAGIVSIVAAGVIFRISWPEVWAAYTPLTPEKILSAIRQYDSSEYTIKTDYLDMTTWLRENTSLDSLIYLEQTVHDRNGFFRYLTQRALLFTWMDEGIGQYSPGQAAFSRQLSVDALAVTPETLPALLKRYEVNYLVAQAHDSRLYPEPHLNTDLKTTLVYENSTYKIYAIDQS